MSDQDQSVDDAATVPASPVPAVDRDSWKADLWNWLERAGRRAGLPSLVIGLVALGLSAASLSYVIANYRLTIAGNRPFLASYGLIVDFDPRSLRAQVGFNNVGKVTARRGTVTLYSLDKADAEPEKLLISLPIVGAGTNVFPGFGSNSTFNAHLTDGAPFILVCANYFDDAGNIYKQPFLFQRSQTQEPVQVTYTELAPPGVSRCPQSGVR